MTTYTNPLGAIQTSITDFSYYDISSVNFYLSWNNVAAAPGANLFSAFMYVKTTLDGSCIYLPPANESGSGQNCVIQNTGSKDINLSLHLCICSAEQNCPFLTCIILPVSAIAFNKSVCLHKNAGICIISTTSEIIFA